MLQGRGATGAVDLNHHRGPVGEAFQTGEAFCALAGDSPNMGRHGQKIPNLRVLYRKGEVYGFALRQGEAGQGGSERFFPM